MTESSPTNNENEVMRSKYLASFYEEVTKGMSLMNFMSRMANSIDQNRFGAMTALYKADLILDEENSSKAPPEYEPIVQSELNTYENYLARMIFVYAVDQANTYISEILKCVFQLNLSMLKNKSSITWEEVISSDSIEHLKLDIVESYVRDLSYKSSLELFKFLNEKHGINPFSENSKINFFYECNLIRNILTHNDGVVSKEFIAKYKSAQKYALNDTIILSLEESLDYSIKLLGMMNLFDKYLCDKFKIPKQKVLLKGEKNKGS